MDPYGLIIRIQVVLYLIIILHIVNITQIPQFIRPQVLSIENLLLNLSTTLPNLIKVCSPQGQNFIFQRILIFPQKLPNPLSILLFETFKRAELCLIFPRGDRPHCYSILLQDPLVPKPTCILTKVTNQ
jgi:hypothetical protein